MEKISLLLLFSILWAGSDCRMHKKEPIVDSFDGVLVRGPMSVTMKKSQKSRVMVYSPNLDLLNLVKIRTFGNKLYVTIDGVNIQDPVKNYINVEIDFTNFDNIEFQSMASGKIDTLTTDDLTINLYSMAKLYIYKFAAKTLNGNIDNMSHLKVSGRANSLDISVKSMSSIEASYLKVESANISCDSMSKANIYATKEVSASATSMSKIQIIGGARIKKRSEDFMSSIDAL